MLSQRDAFQKAHQTAGNHGKSTEYRIKFANSVLLITRPEIPDVRHSLTVINAAPSSHEPVFTREVVA